MVKSQQPQQQQIWNKTTVQLIQAELAKIKKKLGEVTNQHIVDAARDAKNPLHKFFEWNKDVAAEKYRLIQAGEIVRSIRVFVERVPPEKKSANVVVTKLPEKKKNGARGPLHVIKEENDSVNREIIVNAKTDLKGWVSRYEKHRDLFPVVLADILRAMDRLEEILNKNEKKAAI